MSFENCKKIEINGKVFDCLPESSTNDTTYMVGYGRYSNFFLEAIGAKPVIEMPEDGQPILVRDGYCQSWTVQVATGRKISGNIETYWKGEDSYTTWIEWKHFRLKQNEEKIK